MAATTIKHLTARLLPLLAVVVVLASLAESGFSQPVDRERTAVVLDLDGIVSPATADYLIRGIARAQSEGAALIVIRIDTPGGLDTSMRDIIRSMMSSPVPVVAWVGPGGARAASAGTFILYAAHVAAMAPATNVGAATPIELTGGMPFDDDRAREKLREAEDEGEERDRAVPKDARSAKVVNDAAAYIRGLAELRGRNADWAESAVREGVSISARRALEENVIDLTATDFDHLLEQIAGRTVEIAGGEQTLRTEGLQVVRVAPDWRSDLLSVIAHPNVAFILLAIGMYGLIFEFASPGMVFPGVIGAISLLLGLFALNVMPVDYAGVGLMLLGLAFMVAEAFAPSFGILGIGGAAAFAIGAIMAFDTEVPGYELSIPLVIGLTATTAGLVIVALTLLLRTRWRRVETGSEALIGAEGHVLQWSGDQGQVMVLGERWQARSSSPLTLGEPVEVAERHGFILQVRPKAVAQQEGDSRR